MTIAIKPSIGSNSDDILNGGNGHELFSGRGGNDLINTGNGHDVAYGGSEGNCQSIGTPPCCCKKSLVTEKCLQPKKPR